MRVLILFIFIILIDIVSLKFFCFGKNYIEYYFLFFFNDLCFIILFVGIYVVINEG